MPIDEHGAGTHPLLISEVMAAAGQPVAFGLDGSIGITCPRCQVQHFLGEAIVSEGVEPGEITRYSCPQGEVLAIVGHPAPIPMPGLDRHRFGDFTVQCTGVMQWMQHGPGSGHP